MPGFYAGTRSHSGQLPLTPPDSGSGGYGFRSIHYPHDPYAAPRLDGAHDLQASYLQSAAAASSAYGYQQGSFSGNSLPPILNNYWDPVGAPVLPPLRINDREDYARSAQPSLNAPRDAPRAAPKEEKATGGVSAKLDYEMERMTDFVTQAAQSIFQHTMQSHPSFRKWVHQVLSATRLPSATILLSLHYLSDRLAKHPASVPAGENQIYRLLAVALILGSKFLDDNTFINRSWSDVTAIKVAELNVLEMKWLGLIQYQLHIEPSCLQAWLDAWHKFDAEHTSKPAAGRSPRALRHARPERFSPYPTPATSATHMFEPSSRAASYGSGYASSDPWATSNRHQYYKAQQQQQRYPEYDAHDDAAASRYGNSHAYDPIADAARRASDEHARQVAYSYASGAASYYAANLPAYSSGWDQRAWGNAAHRYDCACAACAYAPYRSYALTSGYSAQPVMG